MSREGKLAKNTIIYFIGSFGSKILSFILLPIYANYLTTKAYGSYDLINTIVQIAYPVVTLMLDNALYVFLIGENESQKKAGIVSFVERTLMFNCVIAAIVCLVISLIYPIKYMVWIALWLICYSVYSCWIQIARGFNQQKLYSATGLIVTAVTLLGNIFGLVILRQDYRFLMISNCAAYIISIVFLESKIHAFQFFGSKGISSEYKKKLVKYAMPLLPNQLSWWILNVSDRLMIVYFLGTGANGIYAMACKVPALLNIVHSVFSAAWSDDILSSQDIKDTEKFTEGIYNEYIRIMIGVAIILMAGNRFAFEIIIGGNFVEAYKYTYFLYIGLIFTSLGSLLGAYYGFFKKSVNVSLSTIFAAMINFLINLLFMKKYGIIVASISTMFGSLTIWLVRLWGLRGLVNIKVSLTNKALFLCLIPFYFTDRISGTIPNLLLITSGLFCAVLINRSLVMKAVEKIKYKKNFRKRNGNE